VLLVLQPWGAEVSPWAALAVASGFFYAVGAMATRRWCAGEETLTLTGAMFVAMALWGVLGLGLLAIFPQDAPAGADGFVLRGWVAPGGTFLFWTAVQAVGSLVAVWLITRAYQLGEAPFVALFEYSLLVSVSAWAFALKGERPDALALVGIALIVAAGAVIALRERRLTPPAPEAPA
jgi:drug/metabolite transporter (DMT)-like permease